MPENHAMHEDDQSRRENPHASTPEDHASETTNIRASARTREQVIASHEGGRWCENWCAGFVGEKYEDQPYYRYHGPTVCVFHDDTFVTVETCSYEGSAMFLRVNLPDLIAMLQEVQKILADAQSTGTADAGSQTADDHR